jgi:glycosyltransferase involved in cell wall biosynthesis
VRVVLAGPYPADPGAVAGGVEASFVNLVEGLGRLGDLDLHVVTFVPAAEEPRESTESWGRVRRVPVPDRYGNLTLYRTRRRLLARVLDELTPDVLHAQDALGYGYVCLRAAGAVPTVVSVHGIVRETRKSVRRPRDRLQVALAGVAVERYCVRHARHLVQPTRYPEEYFGREIGGRIVDVGNGVQDAFFAASPLAERGRLLYAGAVVEGKRVLDLVDALARVRLARPEATLRIAGATADVTYAAALDARVREHGLESAVTVLGPLRSQELLEEYRRSSLLLLASAQETSPMVIAEAMAAGVPVVATSVGGVPYLVDDGRTGSLVAVGDVPALAARITELLADEPRRKAFGRAARERAEQRFRVTAVAARVRRVYADAAAERSVP